MILIDPRTIDQMRGVGGETFRRGERVGVPGGGGGESWGSLYGDNGIITPVGRVHHDIHIIRGLDRDILGTGNARGESLVGGRALAYGSTIGSHGSRGT